MHVEYTAAYLEWLGLLDKTTQGRITARVAKLTRGLWGDAKGVGGGVIELREKFGPGYRVYCFERGAEMVVVLGGGDKSTQQDDIRRAIELARQF